MRIDTCIFIDTLWNSSQFDIAWVATIDEHFQALHRKVYLIVSAEKVSEDWAIIWVGKTV